MQTISLKSVPYPYPVLSKVRWDKKIQILHDVSDFEIKRISSSDVKPLVSRTDHRAPSETSNIICYYDNKFMSPITRHGPIEKLIGLRANVFKETDLYELVDSGEGRFSEFIRSLVSDKLIEKVIKSGIKKPEEIPFMPFQLYDSRLGTFVRDNNIINKEMTSFKEYACEITKDFYENLYIVDDELWLAHEEPYLYVNASLAGSEIIRIGSNSNSHSGIKEAMFGARSMMIARGFDYYPFNDGFVFAISMKDIFYGGKNSFKFHVEHDTERSFTLKTFDDQYFKLKTVDINVKNICEGLKLEYGMLWDYIFENKLTSLEDVILEKYLRLHELSEMTSFENYGNIIDELVEIQNKSLNILEKEDKDLFSKFYNPIRPNNYFTGYFSGNMALLKKLEDSKARSKTSGFVGSYLKSVADWIKS